MRYDIDVEGRGFYQITANTKRGTAFMTKVEGFDGHIAYTDDSRLAQDIADGAMDYDLNVRINGKRYIGDGKVAA